MIGSWSGRQLAGAAVLLAVGMLATACSTTISRSQRLARLAAAPDELLIVWSLHPDPARSNIPAPPLLGLGVAGVVGSLASPRQDSYLSETGRLVTALRTEADGRSPASIRVRDFPLPTNAVELRSAIDGAPPEAAVLVAVPAAVTSHCAAGCYAFQVRIDYLSPVTRATVWSGQIDMPPKAMHSGSFEPLARDFLDVLSRQLAGLRLMPGAEADLGQPPPVARVDPVAGARRLEHRRVVPPATGFARTDDVAAVPVRPEGKARYEHYLTLPRPKAFFVYATGGWRFFYGQADAMSRGLDHCAERGETCWLYAVDDRVVWDAVPERRIGRSSQLVPR